VGHARASDPIARHVQVLRGLLEIYVTPLNDPTSATLAKALADDLRVRDTQCASVRLFVPHGGPCTTLVVRLALRSTTVVCQLVLDAHAENEATLLWLHVLGSALVARYLSADFSLAARDVLADDAGVVHAAHFCAARFRSLCQTPLAFAEHVAGWLSDACTTESYRSMSHPDDRAVLVEWGERLGRAGMMAFALRGLSDEARARLRELRLLSVLAASV
jgi:hypothetical protein